MQMPETTSPRFQNVPPLPSDILLYILDCVQHSDLPALRRVIKIFHDCASNILYRNITAVNILDVRVCKTLSQSPGLAARVKHFKLTPASREKIVGSGVLQLFSTFLRDMTISKFCYFITSLFRNNTTFQSRLSSSSRQSMTVPKAINPKLLAPNSDL